MEKGPEAFRTISEVAEDLDVPQHVLRFWESRFHEIRPMKRGGGRRYYRPQDVDLRRGIRHRLYGEGYTIRGVQRVLREQGHRFVQSVWQAGAPQPTPKDDNRELARPTAGRAAGSEADGGGTDDTEVKFASTAAEEGRLSQAQVQKLRAALQELSECRRLLDAAVGDGS